MKSPWSEIVMGSISLFPLFGELKNLEGFFPRKKKHWFITFATIFSLIIFIYLQKYLDKLEFFPFYISPFTAAFVAFLALILYILFQMSFNPKYGQFSSWKKGGFIVISFILFFVFVAGLTFSFNFIERMGEFTTLKGSVVTSDQVSIEKPVKIELSDILGDSIRPHFTKKNGRFVLFFKNDLFNKIGSIRFSVQIKNNVYVSTTQRKDIPENEWQVVLLKVRSF